MNPTDLRRLNAMVKEETESSKKYTRMSKDFALSGLMPESRMLQRMAKDEAVHAELTKKIIRIVNKLRR